jgi:hypothetical protein
MNEEKIVAVFTSKDCDFDLDYSLYNIQNFDYKLNINLPIHVFEILKDKAEKYNLDIEYVCNCVFYEYFLNHGIFHEV